MTVLTSRDVIEHADIKFGTSGARGLVESFSNSVCYAFVRAFFDVLENRYDYNELAIGIDNRPSSLAIAQACADAASHLGIKVIYCGVLPTPAIAFFAINKRIPAIMVTGSHIPFDRNGLKFYTPDGEITKQDEHDIISSVAAVPKTLDTTDLFLNITAVKEYKQRYLAMFKTKVLTGKKVGVYEHSSAGRDIYCELFEDLGAEVIRLGRTDHFVAIDTEAVSTEDKDRAIEWRIKYDLDAIFSTDGDGDRPMLANEKGVWLTGDELGLLCSRELGIDALAVPVSSSTAIETSTFFQKVKRTKIGSPYVIAALKELEIDNRNVAGFEANGGYILATDVKYNEAEVRALPTRDALLPAIIVIAGDPISFQQAELPNRFTASDRLTDYPREKAQLVLSKAESDIDSFLKSVQINHSCIRIDRTDGLRMTMDNLDIVHLRPSGNAPELRCYVETNCSENSFRLLQKTLSNLKKFF
jgi:phosphomannomutase